MAIVLDGIARRFGGVAALEGIDLEIRTGELLVLLGPSGSGKTTLLRVLAGLEPPDEGRLILDGEDATGWPPRARGVGFVFQHHALFRHKTVFDNVAFGLDVLPRRDRPPRAVVEARVNELLRLVRMEDCADRTPAQLSGGQRQRVGLARALAVRPRLLLLDEPFGALDARVRQELRRWLRGLHDALGVTTVFVTHDRDEALELADRIAVMHAGRIEQAGTPAEVYDRPASPTVLDVLGHANRLEGMVDGGRLHLPGGLAAPAGPLPPGPALAYLRPEDIALAPADDGPARVVAVHPIGPATRIALDLAGTPLDAAIPRGDPLAAALRPGSRCTLTLHRLHAFPAPAPRAESKKPAKSLT